MREATWLALGLSAICALALGCDRNIAPFDPSEKPRQPDLSRIFPIPDESSRPAGEGMAAAPPGAGRAGAAIRGSVYVEGDGRGGAGSVLFVIARPAGAVGGPPLAVVRIPEPRFPLDFEIGPDDVMMPAMRFEGPIELSARLDTDGNASTRAEGDRETRSAVAASPGDAGVALRLE